MRSTILAAIAVTTLFAPALAACGGETPPPEAPPPPPPPPVDTTAATPPPADTTPPPPPPKPALADVIPQTLKGIGDAFNAHDAQKMAGFYTDDAAVYDYGSGETHSRGDMSTGLAMLFTAFPDAKSAANRVWIKGNVVVSELTWTGTMTGDMGPFKATGKPVGSMRVHIMWFTDDGLVKEMHEYGDDAGTMAQMKGDKNAPVYPAAHTTPSPLPALVGVMPGSSITIVSRVGSSAEDPTPIKMSEIRIAATLLKVTEPRHPRPNSICIGQVNGRRRPSAPVITPAPAAAKTPANGTSAVSSPASSRLNPRMV